MDEQTVNSTEFVELHRDGQRSVYIEAVRLNPAEDVAALSIPYDDFSIAVKDAIEKVTAEVQEAVNKVKPTKFTLEFGIEMGIESGQLTALIAKGSGKANLKIVMEWEPK